MIDHLSLSVSHLKASRAFYQAGLAPLGYVVIADAADATGGEFGAHVGFGAGRQSFWIGAGGPVATGIHIAFTAPGRDAVDAFHAAALAAGGIDNGAPGPRPRYHEHYYGAFVLDPDGNNIEAVCHAPQP